MTHTITLRDGAYGYVVAEHHGMPGCMSQGRTQSEALRNLADAIDAMWQTAKTNMVTACSVEFTDINKDKRRQ